MEWMDDWERSGPFGCLWCALFIRPPLAFLVRPRPTERDPNTQATHTHTNTTDSNTPPHKKNKQVFPTFELSITEAPRLPEGGAEAIVPTADYEADEVRAGVQAPRSA